MCSSFCCKTLHVSRSFAHHQEFRNDERVTLETCRVSPSNQIKSIKSCISLVFIWSLCTKMHGPMNIKYTKCICPWCPGSHSTHNLYNTVEPWYPASERFYYFGRSTLRFSVKMLHVLHISLCILFISLSIIKLNTSSESKTYEIG